jgi:hypothetical protein
MSMAINIQLIAYVLALFIGIREWIQPSIAARGFGVPLVAPADRDFLAIRFPCHQGEPRHRFGRSHPYFASLGNGDPDVDNRRAVAKGNVANRSTGGNRPTHSSSFARPNRADYY